MKKQIIKFHAINEHVMQVREKPQPASSFVPNWWKKMEPYVDGKYDLNPSSTVTAKKCFPLLDGMNAGYIVPLWADVLVTQENGMPRIKWATSAEVVSAWPHHQSKGFEVPEGFSDTAFKYLHDWIIETPKNWSSLIVHPVGFQNLPFRTITGLVDTDKLKTQINSPFFVKTGFEGIIEKGTPMFQIIPIKRDFWKSEYTVQSPSEQFFNHEKLMTKLVSSYGRYLREKKNYE